MTRHDLDLFSLLSGLVLTGIALAALFDVSADIGPWVWPTVLIAVGVVVLVSVLSSGSAGADEQAVTAGGPADHHRPADDRRAADDPVLAEARAEVEEADHTTE